MAQRVLVFFLFRDYSLRQILLHLHKYFLSFSSQDIVVENDEVEVVAKEITAASETAAQGQQPQHFIVIHLSPEVQLSIERPADGTTTIREVSVTWTTSKYADLIADATVVALLHLYAPPRTQVGQDRSWGLVDMLARRVFTPARLSACPSGCHKALGLHQGNRSAFRNPIFLFELWLLGAVC